MAQHNRSAQTGAYLRMLLARPGAPRSVWERRATAPGSAEIDVVAVADVLRAHGGEDMRVIRAALDGTEVSAETLETFIEAFEVGPRHADRLRGLLRGSDAVRVISGDARADLYRQVGPPQHTTLALHEMHTLGPDGLPAEHQTIQVIQSTVEQLATYPYRFDTDTLVVEVVRGGKLGDSFRLTETLYGVDIVLDRPLTQGDSALMHYRATFGYRQPPPPEFRRGVLGVMRDITMWVQFHPARLPARVWVGRWDRLDDANAIEEQRVDLDGEYSVQVRYDEVRDAIVGFHWSWD